MPTKTTDLPIADTPLTGAEIVYVVQDDNSRQTTVDAIAGSGTALRLRGAPVLFTSSGTYTPDAEVKAILVEVQGAGGGGGGVSSTAGGSAVAGNGGAGGYGKKLIDSVSASYTATVGALGAGGSAGNNAGSTGGTSSFTDGVLTLTASGGVGGSGSSGSSSSVTATGGAGGAASGGDVNVSGASGEPGHTVSGVRSAFGKGADAVFGRGGVQQLGNGDGPDATGFGAGGGSGACTASSSNRPGGDGSAGLIIVWEYV